MNADVPDTVRLFFALWPELSVAQKLHAVALDKARHHGGRAMRRETLHLTLAFLGNISSSRLPAAQAVGDSIEVESFKLMVDRLGYWKHNCLLWAGCSMTGSGLAELAATLNARLRQNGFALEERTFTPHVTLVRNLTEVHPETADMPEIQWECVNFALVRSVSSPAGTIYRRLSEWKLGR